MWCVIINDWQDYYCVFDFGDPSGTYGLTMTWNIKIDDANLHDDDDTDDPPNFASLFVVNYETGEWRRVFVTGDADTDSAMYSADVYAAPGEFVRWVSYTDDHDQLYADAEVRFGTGPLECNPGNVVPDVKYLPDERVWVTPNDLGGDPDYNLMGVDHWTLPNDENQRSFANCEDMEG